MAYRVASLGVVVAVALACGGGGGAPAGDVSTATCSAVEVGLIDACVQNYLNMPGWTACTAIGACVKQGGDVREYISDGCVICAANTAVECRQNAAGGLACDCCE